MNASEHTARVRAGTLANAIARLIRAYQEPAALVGDASTRMWALHQWQMWEQLADGLLQPVEALSDTEETS